jgi:type II secretory pathway pseudopilin PulG
MFKRRKSKRGFTLLEAIIAIGISSAVMVTIMTVQYLSARTIKELYGPTRARSVRTNALNQIRFRLSDARIGTCEVFDNNRRIRFQDPNLVKNGVPVTSEFYFDSDNRTLYYDDDISTMDAHKVSRGPIDITFNLGSVDLDIPNHLVAFGVDALVTVAVKTASELAYSKVDIREGESVVYLRNI